MIGIINYGSGNIEAIVNIYNRLNIECKVINKLSEFNCVDRLVLPGVGSFDECMKQLIESGFKEKLNKLVLESKIPILGICYGLQLIAKNLGGKVKAGKSKREFGKVNLKFRKDYFKYFLIFIVLIFVALPYADLSFPKHFLSNL